MVSVEEKLKGFDAGHILQLCRDHLGGPWQELPLERFKYKPMSLGFGNRLFLCEMDKEEEPVKQEDEEDGEEDETTRTPSKVVVRLFGGNVLPKDAPIRSLNETSETLVFYVVGAARLGPKLHAVFPGGRIEQFIASRTLTLPEWLTDVTVNQEIASVAGNFHCLKQPISKVPWSIGSIVDASLARFAEKKQTLNQRGYLSSQVHSLIQFDFKSEIEFVTSVLAQLKQRVVFASNDMNRSNFLVLTDPKTGRDLHPRKILLIDYEFCSYNYRGFDLGNYFAMKVFDFGGENFLTGQKYPCIEYRKQFVQKYIETVRICPSKPDDWNEETIDSLENILMEADFGSFAVRLINIAWLLRDLDTWMDVMRDRAKRLPDVNIQNSFSAFPDFYRERKEQFLSQYPQFRLSE